MSGRDHVDQKALTLEVRALLSARRPDEPCLSYQALAAKLGLIPPGTIQRVAAALEQIMQEDVAAGRPMIAALVVSRTGDMPAGIRGSPSVAPRWSDFF